MVETATGGSGGGGARITPFGEAVVAVFRDIEKEATTLVQTKLATLPPLPSVGAVRLEGYNSFCAKLPHATHVVQWGGAHVWKVGGKVFAIAGWNDGEALAVTFKCSPLSFDLLKEQKGLRPAPYLASRGMMWIQRTSAESMDDAALKDYLRESHRLASLDLPKKTQRALGLNSA